MRNCYKFKSRLLLILFLSLQAIVSFSNENKEVAFEIDAKIVVFNNDNNISAPPPPPYTSNNSSKQERRIISGTVTDANREPIIGAIVLIKGTAAGTFTDDKGEYSFAYSENNAVIEVSYMGYKTVEKLIDKSTVLNFQLEEDTVNYEEVVVVAHGSQKRESVVGAITTVRLDNLKVPVSKLSSALGGQLAGVVTVQSSGEPGSGADFYIRGIATFGSNKKPLVLVDGIERSMDLVDVEDIASFSILKDASATAVYGVRGANGVVIINTKKGTIGKTSVSVKYEHGILTPIKMPKLVDAYDFANLYNEAIGYNYYNDKAMEQYRMADSDPNRDKNLYPNVDWIDELFDTYAQNQRLNASITGGGKIARYYIATSYYNESSIFKEDKMADYSSSIRYQKINFRANVDVNITPTTEIGVKIANIFETKNEPGRSKANVWNSAFTASPNAFPTYYTDDETGEWLAWAGPIAASGWNPYNELINAGYSEAFNNSTQATISLNQTFGDVVPGLSFRINYSWDAWNLNSVTRSKEVPQFLAQTRDDDGNLILQETVKGSNVLGYGTGRGGWTSNGLSNYLESSLNYSKIFNDKHQIGALVLYNHKINTYVGAGDKYNSLPFKNQGLAARLTYSYDSRYFIEANAGYNGSENFSPGNRFGLFPSVAAGWILTNEHFFKLDPKYLSFFKIRASYGMVGNDQIGGRRYIYNATINTGAPGYGGMGENGGYNPGGIAVGEVANPNVGWEESTKTNVGLELGFLNNALKITTEYFHENREGIFMQRAALPNMSGISITPWVNVGKMKNSGVEANIEYLQTIGNWTISARANWSYARNIILDNDEPDWKYKYQNRTGKSNGQIFGFISEGLFEDQKDIDSSPEQTFGAVRPGDIKYRDVNGDGRVDAQDKVAIGYPALPEIIYGFGATAYWKGLSFSVFFQGIDNANIFLNGGTLKPFESGSIQRANFNNDVIDNIWRESNPNPNATYPRVSLGQNSNNVETSTYWMRDRSYFRLKNAEIGYQLPSKIASKIKLQKIMFYVQGVNLVTFSKFKLWDPENGGGQGNAYPLNTVINVGVQIVY